MKLKKIETGILVGLNFIFIKKNYNYFFALKKILPNVYQSFIGVIWCVSVFEFRDIKLHIASLKGLLSSIFLMKSYFRPNLDKY